MGYKIIWKMRTTAILLSSMVTLSSAFICFVSIPSYDVIQSVGSPVAHELVAYTNTVKTLDSSLKNRPHHLLGSSKYTREILDYDTKYGPRKAFTIVMSDVIGHQKELDKNTSKNLSRLHHLISQLVDEIGDVDPEMHYFRNYLNQAPKTLNELIHYNANVPSKKRWYLLSADNSMYHMQGENGPYHLKFNSYDGYCEAVYDRSGQLLDETNDPVNMGTYNYAAGISSPSAHAKYDVSPYLLYGNTMNSPQKGIEAINTGVKSAKLFYTTKREDVFLYRKKLFGVQSGRVK